MNPLSLAQQTQEIKSKAKALGFDHCGISRAGLLEDEARKLEQWLHQGKHGTMSWMENWFDKRVDPTKLVEGAKSVITVLLNYAPNDDSLSVGQFKISRYAYGQDYHDVLKKKMSLLVKEMQEQWGDFNARIFVDSAPVMDKAWAKKSGLGWMGKNSNIITKTGGSYFFIAEIICDLKLVYDGAIKDYCGSCTRCIDACPTDAITEAYVVDGSKCISYLTIELKESIPAEYKGKMDNWVFGCDICQEVCPWNSFMIPHQNKELLAKEELQKWRKEEVTEEVFKTLFNKSAIKRTKFQGFQRNISFLSTS
ncbi:MAG TPA: tRNA epoxyqueuosine(34) reductase QueG [Cytophagaceae bacterium]|jgi:epoxyqueuosine reductase|nr:tRNA epoxyqueuosine(34) reductase QueG [Cytophagaceae bacterium]